MICWTLQVSGGGGGGRSRGYDWSWDIEVAVALCGVSPSIATFYKVP